VVAAVTAYYNEIDPYAAQWLRNLIAAGHIAPGDVDERSIEDVRPDDLRGYTQCHFFAGIGGWSLALRLAGWSDDRHVWTGSCPCQPFSVAGKQRGSDDERHLWPAFFRLIRECRPAIACGEQVAGAAGYAWWDHVAADLESEGYAAAACDLGAHSVGAPHRRQRLYWVAHADRDGLLLGQRHLQPQEPEQSPPSRHDADRCGEICGMVDTSDGLNPWADVVWLPCSDGKARPVKPGIFPLVDGSAARVGRLRAGEERLVSPPLSRSSENRVGRLRGYGNAIVPQVAAEFVAAYIDALRDATG
jgi:DNA (cytosine-5)-methyltransferase 1